MHPYRETIKIDLNPKPTNWKNKVKCFFYGHDYFIRLPSNEALQQIKTIIPETNRYNFFQLECEIFCTTCNEYFKCKRQEIKTANLSEFIEITGLLCNNFSNLNL